MQPFLEVVKKSEKAPDGALKERRACSSLRRAAGAWQFCDARFVEPSVQVVRQEFREIRVVVVRVHIYQRIREEDRIRRWPHHLQVEKEDEPSGEDGQGQLGPQAEGGIGDICDHHIRFHDQLTQSVELRVPAGSRESTGGRATSTRGREHPGDMLRGPVFRV